MEFPTNDMFAYNAKKKRWNGIFSFIIIGVLAILTTVYFRFFHSSDLFFVKFLVGIFSHVNKNIFVEPTVLGALYTALFGGLFFVFVPVEAFFIKFLGIGTPILILFTYIFGFIISYSINYYIGLKFSKITQKIITPQKFYKLKGYLNRYGGWAIFFINVLPLPSQPLSAILGVFRYNMTRFYFYFILGQLVKYSVIILISISF